MEDISIKENDISSNLKGYLFFWSGQLTSLLGSNIVQFVLIWWITVKTESAIYLSLSAFIGFAPTILLTPIAGVLVDRLNRKGLLGSVDFLQALATVVLLFLFRLEIATIPILLGFIALRGVFQAFHTPAIQALIPIMIPRKHLNRFNSFDFFMSSIIFLVGPLVAAVLYATFPMHQLLWIDAATFMVAVIPLIFIKIPKIKKKVTEKTEKKSSFYSEFKEGISFIREKKGLLSLLSVFTAANLFLMPLFVLMNLFVLTHGGGEIQLSYVLALSQAGTIVGSFLFIFWKGFKKKVNGVALGILIGYIGYIVTTLTPDGLFWFMGIGMLIIGFALPMANISSQTIWQTIVPKEKLGRVMSVRITIAQMTAPVGMILSGFIAEAISIKYLFIASALLGILALASTWFLTSFRKVEDNIIYDDEASEEISEIPSMEIPSANIEPVNTTSAED
ncbi:MAG: MFS transporter [Candidatus Heimdallarchaeota archaeon]|nr:MFS transporter [Candidatus Heimdallarchaeota archaeon]MCK4876362.1 MFS transporter [Candidatus Heimdallarchaeota archaeon]